MNEIGAILLAHGVGDYLIQSHWMANAKTQRGWAGWFPAILHGLTYTLPFVFITQSPLALLVIAITHMVIDHYRIAKWVVWARNQLAPRVWRTPKSATGGPPDGPDWLHVWLLFIADNILHVLINVAAVMWL